VLSLLLFGVFMTVFVFTAFDASPDTNPVAKIFYSMGDMGIVYIFILVFIIVTTVSFSRSSKKEIGK